MKVAYSLAGVMLLQLALVALFHANIAQLVNVMLICGILSLVSLLPFYIRGGNKSFNNSSNL